MSGSNCCFLTYIRISQEADQVVWYSHFMKNFPVFCDPHKGFSVVNEAHIDVVLEFPCFSCGPADVGNLISVSSALSKSSLNIWMFLVLVLLKPGLENFEHYFVSVSWGQLCGSVNILWNCLYLGLEWKLTFPSPVWPLLSFQNFLAYWVQHFHSIIFEDLK